MKKHLCGFFIALTTFLLSFYISPIRFINNGIGHGATADLSYDCRSSNNLSNHFSSVFQWSCNYENPETANAAFENKINNAIEIVEPVEEIRLENGKILHRAIIKIQHENLQSYCLVRTDGSWIDEVASTSLRHVREFEEQRFEY